ncbi:hypothetical protein ABW02_18520 [Niallia circulans]|uniref:Uncharacterized protein n=2 Tax=Bacillaceae TaxID=186817 RepID=A0A2N0Z8H3_9BACI|nr:hypothetical protein ABW02_18520 [Niallia circulans]PKG25811.1 hypothetical protein CWS20_27315 [Cytobacillus horneckiae]
MLTNSSARTAMTQLIGSHRKGDAAYFKLEERPLSEVFKDILEGATCLLHYLGVNLLFVKVSSEQ